MLTEQAAFVLLGALAGGFVAGLAGFGTGLIALGLWLHVIDPRLAASLVLVCSVVAQLLTIREVRHAIRPNLVLPFILGGLPGVPIGTLLLTVLDPSGLRLGVGMVLILFSAVLLVGPPRRPVQWGGRLADGVVGLGGGILSGLAGLSGPLPIMWATLRAWGRDQRRAVFQAFNLCLLATALLSHALAGMLGRELWLLVLAALPGTLLGARLGQLAYRRLSDSRFDRIVLWLLALSGLTLIWGALAK